MKLKLASLFLAVSLFTCCHKKAKAQEILKPEFQSIIDANKVTGAILIYDVQKDVFYANDFAWATVGRLPASTFKIVNSIIALETKVVADEHTVFTWNGEKRAYKSWEQDLTLQDAFKYSCVPCYQEIANKIGVQKMNAALKKLQFGSMQVTADNLDLFWLEGASKINQFQQIDFLKRLINSELDIAKRTEDILRKISFIEKNEHYTLYGKTGLSIRNGNHNGWFVGYAKATNTTYIFATNIEPTKNTNPKLFSNLRKQITLKALELMQ